MTNVQSLAIQLIATLYRLLRRVIFLTDSEKAHERATAAGEWLGNRRALKRIITNNLRVRDTRLHQFVAGIHFDNPIGLAAGFDYQARLTQVLPAVSFGFGTVGTVTNQPHEGNNKPRLGRLTKSRSLMVNKGFKSEGIEVICERLTHRKFDIPIGMSIGRTNTTAHKTQTEAVADMVAAFKKAEHSCVLTSYYELNISCPNLHGDISFYPPKNLEELVKAVTDLKLSKPLFIKMPIEKSDDEVCAMLEVITRYPVSAVVFGNLQKNRQDPSILPEERDKYAVGNFSGKPTWQRSNQLIELAYREYGRKLTIIGCGGVFSAQDAYTKIRLGATLIQCITGLVYKGPQLPAQINHGLLQLLKRDGFSAVSEAIGVDVRQKKESA